MESDLGSLNCMIAPDMMTPEQFYEGNRQIPEMQPIKHLMMAVLEDALRCLRAGVGSQRREDRYIFAETTAWMAERRCDGPFAFETICSTLEVDAQSLRTWTKRTLARQLEGFQPPTLARRSPVSRNGRISTPYRRTSARPAAQAATANDFAHSIEASVGQTPAG